MDNANFTELKNLFSTIEANIDDTPLEHKPEPSPYDQSADEPVYNEATLSDIQGNLLLGFNTNYEHFLFLSFGGGGSPKQFLRLISPYVSVSSAYEVLKFRKLHRQRRAQLGQRETYLSSAWLNLSFSYTGIAKLTSEEEANSFGDDSFRLGMAKRSTFLGDPSDESSLGHQSNWRFGGTNNAIDMMITTAANSKDQLQEFVALIKQHAQEQGIELQYEQPGERLPGKFRGHEHFGFKDGISQPGIRGKLSERPGDFITPRYVAGTDERKEYFAKPGQLLVWPGQFLLGEPRQSTEHLYRKGRIQTNIPNWAKLGSYVVVRRLHQDVSAFWGFVSSTAESLNIDAIEFASRLVGRWPSGAPLMRSPNSESPELGKNAFANNHFLFDDDTSEIEFSDSHYPGDLFPQAKADFLAKVCPHFAHIRKVNPRESVTDLGKPEDNLARMILRRGIPYGPAIAGNPDLSDEDLGNCGKTKYQSSWDNRDIPFGQRFRALPEGRVLF